MSHPRPICNIGDCVVSEEMKPLIKVNDASLAFFACETGFDLLQEASDRSVYVGSILHHRGH
jgi:hypothetical protein